MQQHGHEIGVRVLGAMQHHGYAMGAGLQGVLGAMGAGLQCNSTAVQWVLFCKRCWVTMQQHSHATGAGMQQLLVYNAIAQLHSGMQWLLVHCNNVAMQWVPDAIGAAMTTPICATTFGV